ncbi:hypothetical protein CAEBREN_01186 [Caenorhabditis brenneri]|uniref:F-box domain-containing protein n=1 Tax=Caenorhabditis brenneri TaxID=135651 RepID=G0PEI6_CAEBE|nr:hypothetical protein CAEBREN_01186 [Caenorhabditis brenneri]
MPDLVMRKILKDCDLFSILKLRKVCRGFRDFINHTKPESTLECITLYVCPNEIEMALEILKNGNLEIHHVVYLKHFNGCTIQYESYKKEKYIKFGNDDFRNVFFNDLKAVLDSRGSTLKRFELRVESKFQRFLDFNCWDMFKLDLWKNEGDFDENLAFTLKSVGDYLKSRVQPFKVAFIFMEIEKQEGLMQWLHTSIQNH